MELDTLLSARDGLTLNRHKGDKKCQGLIEEQQEQQQQE